MAPFRAPTFDGSARFSPELLELLVETIPLLVRSKPDLLKWFRAFDVPEPMLVGWRRRLKIDAQAVRKYEITRDVLRALNESGDDGMRLRRSITEHVASFKDFSMCWPNDEGNAKHLVAEVRKFVTAKANEAKKKSETPKPQPQQSARKVAKLLADSIRKLSHISDPGERARRLAIYLNHLLGHAGITTTAPFAANDDTHDVDGTFPFEGDDYSVDCVWSDGPTGRVQASHQLVRIFHPIEHRALILSPKGYDDDALNEIRTAGRSKVVAFASLAEIASLLDRGEGFDAFLRAKARTAVSRRHSLSNP